MDFYPKGPLAFSLIMIVSYYTHTTFVFLELPAIGLRFARQLSRLLQNLDHKLNTNYQQETNLFKGNSPLLLCLLYFPTRTPDKAFYKPLKSAAAFLFPQSHFVFSYPVNLEEPFLCVMVEYLNQDFSPKKIETRL